MSNLSAEELIVIKAALEKDEKPSSATIILKLKVKQEIDKRLGF